MIDACAVDDCTFTGSLQRGWCRKHYDRWRLNGDPLVLRRVRHACSVEGCDGLSQARDLCRKHYDRWYRYGDPLGVSSRPNARTRFLSKVDRRGIDECWPWLGTVRADGYARFLLNGREEQAHRAAHILFVGPIPDGYEVDHVRANGCTRTDCVNWVRHLEAVTPYENNMRSDSAAAVRARQTHCDKGHEFTPENTRITREGWRKCRICEREQSQKYRDNNRELVRTRDRARNPRHRATADGSALRALAEREEAVR